MAKNLYGMALQIKLKGKDIQFERTPFNDKKFITENTSFYFSDNHAPNLPIMQNIVCCIN